ncbi:unnamed protein product [Ranitomeya imitator]|uniref:KATNIP domain-containing protein n=1 Tax=Ranitomeya imitator TaxID=111125 RepID=A0ABN9KNG5_9NEOB|nr:unnamed protein product [Ranitomeya imitator]
MGNLELLYKTKVNRLDSDDCKRVWKKQGKKNQTDREVEGTVKFGGGSLMICGYFKAKVVGYLTRIDGDLHAELCASDQKPVASVSLNLHTNIPGVYTGRCLQLNFTMTWGDQHYLGLTGLEIVGSDGEALSLSMNIMTASPPDLSVLPEYQDDSRTLDKLIDGMNITSEDSHMWLIPFTCGENHTITISFDKAEAVAGLRFWNYNKSPEDTYRGVMFFLSSW